MPTKNSILDYAAGKFYPESQNRDTSQNVVSANQTPKIYTGLASAAAQAESAKSFVPSVDFAALREQSSQKSGAGNIPKLTQTSVGSVYPKSGSQITIEDAQKAYDEEKKKNDALNEKLSLMKQDLGDFWEQAYRPEEVQKIKDDILQSNKSLSEAEKTLNSLKTKRDADKVASDVKEIFSMPQDDSNALEDYIRGQDELSNMDAVEGRYQYLARVKELDDLIAPLEEKYGKDRVSQLLESYRRFLHEDDAQEMQDRVAQLLASSPYEATVNNIYATVSKPFSDVAATIGRAEELAARSGYLETLDPYTYRDMGNVYTSAVRSQTLKNIEGEDPNFVRKGLSIGYQAVNSLADNAMRLAVAGPTGATGAATLAAMGSFSQTVSDAAQRGATPEQAWALGIVNAGIEAITEKIPLDNLLTIAKGGGAKDLVKNVIRSMAIEATEEELSLIGNTLADAAIMREKSEYNQRIAQLMEDGKTQEEAREIADRELVLEALNTAAVSGISGGIGGFGASKYYAYFGDRNTGLQTAQKPSGAADASAETAKNPQQAIAAGAAKDITRQAMENGSIHPQPQQTQQEVNLQNAMKATLSEEGKKSVDIGAAQKYDNNTPIGIHASIGNSGVTYTSDNQAVNFQYAIVPAESLIASNDQYGNINKAYPAELQPRDRTRAASQTQINSMSRNLNPALLAESPTAQNGAPIIRGDGVVIGGNGRVSAIVQAYGAGRGGEYQHYITSRAADLGIDPKTLPENPVLVRVANGVDNYTELAHSLNASTTAAYSATEAAKSDASRVGDIVEYLSVSDDGKINTIENKGFIQKFVSQVVPKTERGDVMQSDGKLSQAGERRILNALFYYAYGDISLVERLTESTDNNAKNIINAMLGNSAKVAKLQSEIGRGEIQDFGLRNAITKATNLYLDAKEAKVPVSEVSDQLIIGYNGPESQFDGLTVNLARFMEYNNRSAKQIRDFINILIDVNMNIASDTATEISMFDTGEKKTQEVLYDEAVTAYDKQRDGKGRIPEKSGFSQYKQYKQEDLAAVMGGSGKTGSAGQAEIHGGSVEPVPEDAPGGHWSVDHPSIGAAEQNFTGKANYQQLLSDDNAQPDRADDVRPMEIPKTDMDGNPVSAVAANAYGSRITTDEMASLIETSAANGDLSYVPITNSEATDRAMQVILSSGDWETAARSFQRDVDKGYAGAMMSAQGALLVNHYAQTGDKQRYLQALMDTRKLGTNTAQGLQAMRIMRTLSPPDKLRVVELSINALVRDLKLKTPIEVDRQLYTEYQQATTDDQRDAVIEKIQKNVASQIPATLGDKFTALRYTNMLGNLKTNVRNITGNVGSFGMYRVKDQLGALLEKAVYKASGGKTQRTKSNLVSIDLLKAANLSFTQDADLVSSGGKYGVDTADDGFRKGVMDNRKIFSFKPMEAYRKATNWAMNNGVFGDEAFGRATYTRALAGYLKANGITAQQYTAYVNGETGGISQNMVSKMDAARSYAIQQAQEATFHDNSALARIVNNVKKPLGKVGEGIMPFTKTPANVLTRAEEFSPLGLLNTAVLSAKKARGNADITANDIIDSLSKNLTGTAVLALGAYLFDRGLLTGAPDEDKDKAAFDKFAGEQPYSIRIGGGTYTFDWFTPASMPLFMGAEVMKLAQDEDITFADLEKLFLSIADPMINMSMLQGVEDTLNDIKYAENNLGQFLINAGTSYLFQGLGNTLLGQMEKSTEENRMMTYTDDDRPIPKWMQRQLGKLSQKVPGWDYQQREYRDAYGNFEKQDTSAAGWAYNLASPGYFREGKTDAVTKELYRLEKATGDSSVFPQVPKTTLTYTDKNGDVHKDYSMDPTQADRYQRVTGQTTFAISQSLFESEAYKAMGGAQKAQAVRQIMAYAKENAKNTALPDAFGFTDSWMEEISSFSPKLQAQYIARRVQSNALENAVSSLVGASKNGFSTSSRLNALDSVYRDYRDMPAADRQNVYSQATGSTRIYLESRDSGVSHAAATKAILAASNAKGTGANGYVTDADRYTAIAAAGLTKSQTDLVMHAYLPDYNPEAGKTDKAELKYDYIRQEMNLSPADYAKAMSAKSGYTKKKDIIESFEKAGFTNAQATQLYKLFNGNFDVVAWYESIQK